jgi:SAM-dependent methyltransferase
MEKKELQKVINANIEILGLKNTAKMILYFFLKKILKKMPKDRFDKKYNVSTQDIISLKDLGITNNSLWYVPTHERVLNHVIRKLNIRYEDYIFIDIGCGKGRALLMAMLFPFKRIIGVELTETISNLAKDNVEILKQHKLTKCTDIEVQCKDATNFDPPNDNLAFFLYYPFRGRILNQVLDNIYKSHADINKKILIAYVHLDTPEKEVFLSKSYLKKLLEYRTFNTDASWSLWELQ